MSLVASLLRNRLAVRATPGRPTADRVWDWLAGAALAAAALLVVLTFTDYGVTWDEDVHNWYGVFALDYYLSLFADHRALTLPRPASITAPVFDMIAAAINRVSPLGTLRDAASAQRRWSASSAWPACWQPRPRAGRAATPASSPRSSCSR